MQTFRDVYRFRELLLALTAKELKAQYRNMALGFFWALLNPLVMVAVLSWVFIVFFGGGLDQPGKVIVGLIPYNFFAYCVSGCTAAIVGNSVLVKKVHFPRQILPISVVLTSLVHFAVQSTLVALVLIVFPTPASPLTWNLLWLAPIVLLQVALCTATGLLVSALNAVFRDTRYIVDSGLTVLFWLSPAIYDAREMFEKTGGYMSFLEHAYFFNPLAGILDAYRAVLLHGSPPNAFTFGAAIVGTLIAGVIGVRTFWIQERHFADLIQ